LPRFRESAYTKIKQQIGEGTPGGLKDMEKNVERAALKAINKRKRMIKNIKSL